MSPTPDTTTDPFLDEQWLATTGPRSRWRIGLLAALAVTLVFLGGAQVQKHFGAASTTGAPSGQGFPTGQGIPSGFPQLGGGSTQPSSAPSGTGQQSASLIGTVTRAHGDTLEVKDFGGKTHTIRIGARTSITRLAKLSAGDITRGSTVVVERGPGSSTNRAVTSITVR
jgi:hypothetical protein